MQRGRSILVGLAACLMACLGCQQMRLTQPSTAPTAADLASTQAGPADARPPAPGPDQPPGAPVTTRIAFSTVLAPDLPQRPITLAECIALALENGRTGDAYD